MFSNAIIIKFKNINIKAMKTINRKLKQNRIALLVAAILLSLNIGMGQDEFLSQLIKKDYKNQSASSLLQMKYDYKLNIESQKEDLEPEAEIENWMSDINLWSSEEMEEEAEIENWMLNTNFWKNTESFDNEEELKIEDWMLKTDFWKTDISDNELEIETWMLKTNFWSSSLTENELEIEGWMMNSNLWL